MKCIKNHKYKIVSFDKELSGKYLAYLQCKCGDRVILRFMKDETKNAINELWLFSLIDEKTMKELKKKISNVMSEFENKKI